MSELHWSQADAIDEARSKGFSIVRSKPTRLLLDLDTGEDEQWFEDNFDNFCQTISRFGIILKEKARWRSKSGGTHIHLIISQKGRKKELTIQERLLIEVCLGSDRKRGFLSLCRFYNGNDEPGTLFKPPVPENKYPDTSYKVQVPIEDDVPF